MKNLGFGMMRLPVLSGPTDFDYDQLNQKQPVKRSLSGIRETVLL